MFECERCRKHKTFSCGKFLKPNDSTRAFFRSKNLIYYFLNKLDIFIMESVKNSSDVFKRK